MRTLIPLLLLVVTATTTARSQTAGCGRDIPLYNDWIGLQKIPFLASEQRQKELTINYPKMNLGMSKQQTMGTLGSPDFAAIGSLDPHEITCVWGYAVEDSGNAIKPLHRGILVGFDGNGLVVSLEPNGLAGLKGLREIDVSCKSDSVDYVKWFQSTDLPRGIAYSMAPEHKAQILAKYSKLTLGMSRVQAVALLGKADFELIIPDRTPKDVWNPKQVCAREIGFVITQGNENMTDPNNAGVFLSFDEKDRLFWASPQNVEGLNALGGPMQ